MSSTISKMQEILVYKKSVFVAVLVRHGDRVADSNCLQQATEAKLVFAWQLSYNIPMLHDCILYVGSFQDKIGLLLAVHILIFSLLY